MNTIARVQSFGGGFFPRQFFSRFPQKELTLPISALHKDLARAILRRFPSFKMKRSGKTPTIPEEAPIFLDLFPRDGTWLLKQLLGPCPTLSKAGLARIEKQAASGTKTRGGVRRLKSEILNVLTNSLTTAEIGNPTGR